MYIGRSQDHARGDIDSLHATPGADPAQNLTVASDRTDRSIFTEWKACRLCSSVFFLSLRFRVFIISI
jgi:hypothetical protein